MFDAGIKSVFYVVVGLALLTACVWYVRSLCDAMTGRGEIIIAPFDVVGGSADASKTRGVALAQMLQARLRAIEQDLAFAQDALKPHASTQAHEPALSIQSRDQAQGVWLDLPPILTQPVGLKTALIQPLGVKVSVAGVEVNGLVDWLQGKLDDRRTLRFTLYDRKDVSQVFGSLAALSLNNDSVRVDVPVPKAEDGADLDAVMEKTAFEILRLRLAQDEANRLEVLSGDEFKTLVEVLRGAARLNRRVALGRNAMSEFQRLLKDVSPLANDVPEWYQLSLLAASIAESAKDLNAALQFYNQARIPLSKSGRQAALLAEVEKKIEDVKKQLTDLKPSATASPEVAAARQKIEDDVRKATTYFNALLGQGLSPPPVQITSDQSSGYFAYFDGTKIVVPKDAQYVRDLSVREACWQHISKIVGSDLRESNDSASAIVYSYADVLPMVFQQRELDQNASASSWVLYSGVVESMKGEDLAKTAMRTPLRSFKAPGTAYDDPTLGKDPQVAHMRNYDRGPNSSETRYVNSGILNKAFYEAAVRVETHRALEIWIAALRQLKNEKNLDFQRFAVLLYDISGSDQAKIREALMVVGLDPKIGR